MERPEIERAGEAAVVDPAETMMEGAAGVLHAATSSPAALGHAHVRTAAGNAKR